MSLCALWGLDLVACGIPLYKRELAERKLSPEVVVVRSEADAPQPREGVAVGSRRRHTGHL